MRSKQSPTSSYMPRGQTDLTAKLRPASLTEISSKASGSRSRSAYHPYGGVRKGLTIGHDNYADASAEAFFEQYKDDPVTRRCMQRTRNKGQPWESDEAYERFLMDFYRTWAANLRVRWAHPKATDESVRYTIIPTSPFGKVTIRWWQDWDCGFPFDFVDLDEQKIVAPDENLTVKLQVENASFIYIRSLEKPQMTSKSKNTNLKHRLNADGIVEQRWSVPHSACIALCERGRPVPFAIVYSPSLKPLIFAGKNVPKYLPQEPVA